MELTQKDNMKTMLVKPGELKYGGIFCPTPEMKLWNQHPRIFIRLSEDKPQSKCPYCSTYFQLVSNQDKSNT